jgi:hypothetical protein
MPNALCLSPTGRPNLLDAAANGAARRKHWSEYSIEADPQIARAISAFDTLDDLEPTA